MKKVVAIITQVVRSWFNKINSRLTESMLLISNPGMERFNNLTSFDVNTYGAVTLGSFNKLLERGLTKYKCKNFACSKDKTTPNTIQKFKKIEKGICFGDGTSP